MKIKYTISMNRNLKNLPPWKVEEPDGKSHNVHTIILKVPSETTWEDAGSVYKGWISATGELILDEKSSTAIII